MSNETAPLAAVRVEHVVGRRFESKAGCAATVEELRDLIAPFVGECPIRYDTKGPIEVVYESVNGEGCLILR